MKTNARQAGRTVVGRQIGDKLRSGRGFRTAGLALAVWAATAGLASAEWPSWRGAGATGSVGGSGYPVRWTADGVAWKQALPGKGGSTPVVQGGRLYLTTPADGQDAVVAFDLQGRQQWLTKLGSESPAKHRTLGSSANASPVVDAAGVVVSFRSGRLAALGLDGAVQWQLNLAEKFGEENLFWDTGSSPVLVDGLVVLARLHGGDSWLAAFDRKTGAVRWQEKRNFKAPPENDNGYTTPVVFRHGDRLALLVWGADRLTAHAVADGSRLWTCEGFNPAGTGYWPAIASPVVAGGLAIVPVGRDDRPGQARLHGIRLDGKGDVTSTHRAWKREDVGVFVATPVVHGGHVYLLRHRGEVVCLDPATGRTLWAEPLPKGTASYYASPVIAGGVLYAAREDGMVFAAKVDGKLEVLGENPMGERIVASPAVANGRLFLRGDKHLFCIGAAGR
jgi:outer membrane protein assembly factor BamB